MNHDSRFMVITCGAARMARSAVVVSCCMILGIAADSVRGETRPAPLRVYCAQVRATYAPFYSWPSPLKAPIGHEPDVARAIGKALDRDVRFVGLPDDIEINRPRFDVLAADHADLVISCFTITPERAERVAFSRPYFTDGLGALVRADSEIEHVEQLARSRVIAWEHTTAFAWARKHLPDADIVTDWPKGYRGTPEGLVSDGRVDAYIIDRSNLQVIARFDDTVRVLPGHLTQEQWGVALRRDRAALLAEVNRALQVLDEKGRLEAIRKRWGLEPDEPDDDDRGGHDKEGKDGDRHETK